MHGLLVFLVDTGSLITFSVSYLSLFVVLFNIIERNETLVNPYIEFVFYRITAE